MTLTGHHDWVRYAADRLVVGGNVLWQALCSESSKQCLSENEAKSIVDSIKTTVGGHPLPMGPFEQKFRPYSPGE